jgi:hypothetical protein
MQKRWAKSKSQTESTIYNTYIVFSRRNRLNAQGDKIGSGREWSNSHCEKVE